MKTKVYLYALATTAVLALGSCSESENGETPTAKYITVSSGIGEMSRVATKDDGTQQFEAGDKISVYAWTGSAEEAPAVADRVVDNAINTLGEDGKWTAAPQMLWKNLNDNHYFAAVYPALETSPADLTKVAYSLDLTKQEDCDLLVATSLDGIKAQNNPVQLKFDHVMAKMIVKLSYRNQWGGTPTVTSVKVKNTTGEASVNLLTKKVTVDANSARSELSLPVVSANVEYGAILIPQSDIASIVITIDGKDYVYTHPTNISLESGKVTIVNLIVGRNEATLADVTINDWAEGAIVDDGEAQVN